MVAAACSGSSASGGVPVASHAPLPDRERQRRLILATPRPGDRLVRPGPLHRERDSAPVDARPGPRGVRRRDRAERLVGHRPRRLLRGLHVRRARHRGAARQPHRRRAPPSAGRIHGLRRWAERIDASAVHRLAPRERRASPRPTRARSTSSTSRSQSRSPSTARAAARASTGTTTRCSTPARRRRHDRGSVRRRLDLRP